MSDINRERYIKNSPIPIAIKGIEEILRQMRRCVCKFKNNNIFGTGFFAKIPYKSEFKIVLITCYHVFNEKDIINDNILKISINNEEEYKTIEIDDNRIIITNEELDLTIIEIKDKDKLEDNYLEIDERFNLGDINERYKKESIYILNYPKGDDIVVSFGLLNFIEDKKIFHFCSTEEGSSGSPILSLKTFKLMGIHTGSDHNRDYNQGLFIKYIIDEFNKRANAKIITAIYKINHNEKILKILDDKFIKNNIKNCKLIIDNKELNLTYKYPIKNKRNNSQIEIKIKIINSLTDISYMFYECSSLISLPDICNLDTSKITNMKFLFTKCDSLSNISDISKWDTSKVEDMQGLFGLCSSLEALPDISKWDISKVKNLSDIFASCYSLKSLPDLSKWNTSNAESMNFIFSKCHSLINLPDISTWNISNAISLNGFFSTCSSLKKLPDISKWDISKVKSLGRFFGDCSLLEDLPDISKWNTSNIINMSGLFENCCSLTCLPDISNWDTSKVENMCGLFHRCSKLLSLPDISKWNISNCFDLNSLFARCSSIKNIPDISKWNTSRVETINYIFAECSSLIELPDLSKWDTRNIIEIKGLFIKCPSLRKKPIISPPPFTSGSIICLTTLNDYHNNY